MPPIIHCVRHAQAIHNLSVANHVIPDPILTDLGNEQCRKLREKFPYHSDVELVVSSPLRRTIATSLQGFEPVFQSREGLKLIVHPDLQETSDVPCDTGSNPEVLREEIEKGGLPVDLGLLFDGWNSKKGPYAPTNKEIKNRARAARRWLKARPEKVIVVVTHGGFLHYFTEDWEDSSEYQGMVVHPLHGPTTTLFTHTRSKGPAGPIPNSARSSLPMSSIKMIWKATGWTVTTLR
ncbi:hypothetical protein MAP00_006382 [Monascus purpureus]|nr:hypothetical protein MAP00_006382 [Monascus purpureus]